MSETSSTANGKFSDLFYAAHARGEPIPALLAKAVGHYWGEDLAQVRVHRTAAVSAFNAHALALGENVFFAPDAWRPDTRAGVALLGHELAHVVQQRYLGRTGSGVALLRCSGLEAHADRAGADLAAMLYDRMPTVRGAGRKALGIAGASNAFRASSPAFVQLQEKGFIGAYVLDSPAPLPLDPPFRIGTVIFRQTASNNEVHITRAKALDRVKLKHNVGGSAQRTYYSNANHIIPPMNLGQGEKLRFMSDRALNPVEAYGRYYDFGFGKLIVEHTNDVNCRMIEIKGINAVNVSCAKWSMLPHFHMATYPAVPLHLAKYAPIRTVEGHPDQVMSPPPGYDQASPDGHHVFFREGGTLTGGNVLVPVAAFTEAFAQGAQAVFNLVWVGGW